MRNRNWIIIILLNFFLGLTCRLSERIVGTYREHLNFENATELRIYEGGTYRFKQQSGLIFFRDSGTWRISTDTIILKPNDTTLIYGTPIGEQRFIIQGKKVIEIINNKRSGVKLKKVRTL